MTASDSREQGLRRRWMGRVVVVGLSSGVLLLGLTAQVGAAQQTGTARKAAPATTSSPAATDTKTYPFQQALDELNGRQMAAPAVPSVSAARSQAGISATSAPRTAARSRRTPLVGSVHMAVMSPPVPLSASAEKAMLMAEAEKAESAMPEAGRGGRVTYTFGAGLPTVVTSPMHISIVELEPGETITSEPAIGDSVRWELLPGSSGKGASLQPLIMLKPHVSGLDTNLVVTTDKRTYYLRLVSRESEYMARIGFSYKEDEDARWARFVADQEKAKAERESVQVVTAVVGDAIDKLNFNYDIKGGNAVVRPVRVMDDGAKTYITMPDAVLHQDLPALVVENPKLKGEKGQEIVNYRVKGNLYIVDRIFDRAALVIGSGKAVTKVEIQRRAALSGGR